ADFLVKVKTEEPPRPRSLCPRLDRDMETICLKCLDKDPSRRYRGSAEELAQDLERWERGEPIRARPVSRWERLCKWAHRKPAVAALLAAVFLVTVLGVGGIGWLAWKNAEAVKEVNAKHYLNQIALAHTYLNARQFDRAEETLAECSPALRNWEWHYLHNLCRLERVQLKGHVGNVLAAAFSPGGERMATVSQD